MTALVATLASAPLACCRQPAVDSVVEASAGHFTAFERFERWSERTLSSDVRLRGVQALREAVFAPLRRDRRVVWADVQGDSGELLQYRQPLADAALHFVPIAAPALGRVQVALCEACQTPGGQGKASCVVIARPRGGRHVRIRVAYCDARAKAEARASR